MSLLNSVLGSIGTGNRVSLPKGPDRAASSTPPIRQSEPTKPQASSSKPSPSITAHAAPTSAKRKYEGTANSQRPAQDKLLKPIAPPERSRSAGPLTTPSNSRPTAKQPVNGRAVPSSAQTKAPPKGSFLDLMNQAKEKATSGTNVGVIKHVSKERISKYERRRREEELRAGKKGKPGRVADNGAIKKPGHSSAVKPKGVDPSGYKGTAKPGTNGIPMKDKVAKEQEAPTYKGTAGLKKPPPSMKHGSSYRKAREDRYMDTDEEDSAGSFIVDDDEDEEEDYGRYSKGAKYRYAEDDEDDSDMEAGYDDVETEEKRAELEAKKEDERERMLEERHRREKEARRKAYERAR